MAGLGLILSFVLVFANRKLYVYEDPRIDQVNDMLPQANCGACGSPGCRAFAELVVSGTTTPGKCTVNSPEKIDMIAGFLGVDAGGGPKIVARLACAGGVNVARQRSQYQGMQTCHAANLVAGGGKGCAWGCLGLGDCARVCDFDAITMNEFNIPVVDSAKCVACNDCVEICPKDLFSLHPVDHKLWVACKNLAFGDDAENECEVSCTACGRCALDADEGVIQIKNNLAVINYDMNRKASQKAIDRCPTGAIVWFNKPDQAVKGPKAKKIIRKSALPVQH
ncbi:MAG: RnfABCDGE type electron transport complex subunit B [SAR324 cluster bacterium]|nr:RnfABCDGE type electron transport complex subunit B [SAR324 cluster bacterium]